MASTGALAAERARLEDEIAALSRGLPDEAAAIVERADKLLADHGAKISALKARRDALDQQFGVSEREAAERRAREDAAAWAALVARLNGAAEAFYDATDKAEQHLAEFVDRANEAIAAHAEVRRVSQLISAGGKVPMALNGNDMILRLGGRISGVLRRVRLPGSAVTTRIGPLNLPAEIAPVRVPPPDEPQVAPSWRQREEAMVGGAVADLLERGGR